VTGGSPLPLVLGAGGLAAVGAWLARPGRASVAAAMAPPVLREPPAAWVFPVPTLGDRRAEVSDGWGSPRDGGKRKHLGADVMFRRRHALDQAALYPPGTPHGSLHYFMPDNVPALAIGPGLVTQAHHTPRGGTVTIRHADAWTSYYTHLASLAVALGQGVAAGDALGTIGGDPTDPRHLMHLHLELWADHQRSRAIDPGPWLRHWRHRTIDRGLRNRAATLVYRPVGARGDRYPDWVQALRGKSGVYVIRERDAADKPIVVYVGESHTDNLYETLTRHFQEWRRYKGFWRGQYAEGHDPGLTYRRDRVEVAVRVMSGAAAIDEEGRLIRRLHPRDNLIGQPEDVPF
jgi:hypothetical protein